MRFESQQWISNKLVRKEIGTNMCAKILGSNTHLMSQLLMSEWLYTYVGTNVYVKMSSSITHVKLYDQQSCEGGDGYKHVC